MSETWRQRTSRIGVALLFAISVCVVYLNQPLMAEPLAGDLWEKVSTSEMEAAMDSVGSIRAITEYRGALYMGGMADPDGTGDYRAVIYAEDSNGDWEDVTPDTWAPTDSVVTHMAVFQDTLYVAVNPWDQAPLQIWTYDGAASTWQRNDTFTLNDERSSDYITQVLGIGVVGDELCATVVDLALAGDLAVMCTDGASDWAELPTTGFTSTEFTSTFFTNLLASPSSNGVLITANDDIGDGQVSSSLWAFNDIDDPNGEWVSMDVSYIGADRVVTALSNAEGALVPDIMMAAADVDTFGDVEVWSAVSQMTVPLDETIDSSAYAVLYDTGDGYKILVAGSDASGTAVLKSMDTSATWTSSGPAAEFVGIGGDNPAANVSLLYINDDNDIFLGLKGNGAEGGNSTVWRYDAPDNEDDETTGDANGDGIQDDTQDNVASFMNPVTGKQVSIVLDDSCHISAASAAAESSTVKDAGYDYDDGLIHFDATCSVSSTVVKVYQYGVATDALVVRKYNPDMNAYSTIDGADLTSQTIHGQQVAVATYTITDNGSLDLNPATGAISDPVGLARLVVGTPHTGLGGQYAQ